METVKENKQPVFKNEELELITRNMLDLDTIMRKVGIHYEKIAGWIKASVFPDPTYMTPDGKKWYPKYVLILVERSLKNNTTPKEEFVHDAIKVLSKPGHVYRFGNVEEIQPDPEGVENMWTDFRSGLYGACLRKPTPKNILSKGELINMIRQLVDNPEPGNISWKESLKKCVDELDEIEAQFTDYDRQRFGGKVSRDIFVTGVKEKYPELFH